MAASAGEAQAREHASPPKSDKQKQADKRMMDNRIKR
jgi:hypothetical protein